MYFAACQYPGCGGMSGYFSTSKTFGPGTTFDAFLTEFTTTDDVGFVNTAQVLAPCGGGTPCWGGAYIREGCESSTVTANVFPDQVNPAGEANGCGNRYGSLYQRTSGGGLGVTGVYTVTALTATSSLQYFNYSEGESAQPIGVDPPTYPAPVGFENQNPESLFAYWARVRTSPPNGVMPVAQVAPIPPTTLTTVKCSSSTIIAGASLRCTAIVSGSSPTGTVSWSEADGTGSLTFSSPSCVLSSLGQCQVAVKGSGTGKATARATYGGDANNNPSNGTETITIVPAGPTSVEYTNSNYPVSIYRQYYTPLDGRGVFTARPNAGQSAVSLGIMNGTASFEVSQEGMVLMSGKVTGPTFNYVVVTGSTGYRYVNFESTGASLNVTAIVVSGRPDIAFNVYDNYISNFTASLITYPPQFGAPVWANPTPTNTGMSVVLVAPKYTLPTPLSIQGNLGFCGPGQSWYAQIGFNDWSGGFNVSYFTSLGIFAGFNYSAGGPNVGPIPLVPGDTYNFTMALVSGTTWESLLNGTLTQLVNLHSSYANCGGNYGMETLPWWGGSVNITNLVRTPVMLKFKVIGVWIAPCAMDFTGVGENWNNGHATTSPGISLWGMAGNLQDPSVPPNSLEFNDSLPLMLSMPVAGLEPIYGDYAFPVSSSGGGIVTAVRVNDSAVEVTPVKGSALVSVVTYGSSASITSEVNSLLKGPETFRVPPGTTETVIYAEDTSLTSSSSAVISMAASVTTTSSTATTFTSGTTRSTTTLTTSTLSASISSAASSTSSGGGISEFPSDALTVAAVTSLIAVSYLIARSRVNRISRH